MEDDVAFRVQIARQMEAATVILDPHGSQTIFVYPFSYLF
jgi:hypothetical protein